jgi:dTDP-4-dehydrorhamnose reductase
MPIVTADYPTPARRPLASVLDRTRFDQTFALPRRPWSERLDTVVRRLLAAEPPLVQMGSSNTP